MGAGGSCIEIEDDGISSVDVLYREDVLMTPGLSGQECGVFRGDEPAPVLSYAPLLHEVTMRPGMQRGFWTSGLARGGEPVSLTLTGLTGDLGILCLGAGTGLLPIPAEAGPWWLESPTPLLVLTPPTTGQPGVTTVPAPDFTGALEGLTLFFQVIAWESDLAEFHLTGGHALTVLAP